MPDETVTGKVVLSSTDMAATRHALDAAAASTGATLVEVAQERKRFSITVT